MPPYVALAIVSMQRALGESFQLLTPQLVPALIGTDFLDKSWGFTSLGFNLAPDIEALIAKSDFIRMAYIYYHGGIWIDADTLLLDNPSEKLFPEGLTPKLHWYSEAFFGSLAGNQLLGEAVANSLDQQHHRWGNPGGIKEIVAQRPDQLTIIPSNVVDPGYRPLYNFVTCDVMRRCDITVETFLVNDIDILKLYNTYFTRTSNRQQSVAEFLADETLLAKLFLYVEPDPRYWIAQSDILIEHCQSLRS